MDHLELKNTHTCIQMRPNKNCIYIKCLQFQDLSIKDICLNVLTLIWLRNNSIPAQIQQGQSLKLSGQV